MKRWRVWLHGLAAAAVGGTVGALSDGIGVWWANGVFDLAHAKSTAIGGAISGVLFYLKQSPISKPAPNPPQEAGNA